MSELASESTNTVREADAGGGGGRAPFGGACLTKARAGLPTAIA